MRGRGEREQIAEWVRRGRSGDRRAFSELVSRYKNLVYSICNEMLGNPEDANDAAQETFVRLYRSLNRFDESREFVPWLYKIASNTALSHVKRRDRRARFLTPESDEEAGRALETAAAPSGTPREDNRHAVVRRVLETLPPRFRQICILRYLEDKSYEEIAAITDLPRSTVRGRLNRARRLVEKKLKNAAPELYGE